METLDRLSTLLADRYVIQRELGRGGMATVYLAEDRKHNRRVAIKVLHPELAAAVGAERFLREIGIEARLQHTNILPLYDSGEAGTFLYYVMPYVEGESLRGRIEREGQLPLDETLRIVQEVCDALACAHCHGVIHRDIKPENILLSEGHAVVADFGIAHILSEAGGQRITETGHVVGTPRYMSPEQASGDTKLSARSDIYSLGCVLYEMLAGDPPFTGRTPQAVIAKQILETPPSLRIVRPTVPQPVVEALEKALAKSPADRFASAEEFRAALERSAKAAALERRKPVSRARWLVVAVAVALAGLGTFSIWQSLNRSGLGLDPNKVVVFPLVERGIDSTSAGAGWDVAIAIGGALENTQPLKWIDGWTRLSEPIRANPMLLTTDVANRISRDRSARFYIDGIVRRDRDSMAVVLRLFDVDGDSLVEQETAAVPEGNATFAQVGLRAVTGLLPKLLDPEREVQLSTLLARDPAAIALWIQGEREYRRSRFAGALDFYERAVGADSLLAFAAIKAAQAASWERHLVEGQELIELAVANDSLLPTRYAHLARGFEGYLAGRANSAVSRFKSALAEDPEWSEAAMALAEVYYHLLPDEAPLDSVAAAWFQRAFAWDTAFTPPLYHLAEIAIRRGNIAEAEEFIRHWQPVSSDREQQLQLEFMLGCVRDGPAQFDWGESARASYSAVFASAKALAPGGLQSACAEGAFRAVMDAAEAPPNYRYFALVGLQGLLVAQRRDSDALALVDSAIAAGMRAAYGLYVFDALAGAEMQGKAAEADEAARVAGDFYESAGLGARWLLGAWHAHLGDVEKAARIAEDLLRIADDTGDRRDRLLAGALATHVMVARGDTVQAIARLKALVPTGQRSSLAWDMDEPLAIERLLLARLLLARGEFEEAYRVATVFDHPQPIMFLPCLRSSLLIRLEAAEALNRHELVQRLQRRLAALGGPSTGDSRP